MKMPIDPAGMYLMNLGSGTSMAPDAARIQIVLKQAYHPNWHASGCETHAAPHGNLTVDCPAWRLEETPVELVFRDVLSDVAAHVSIVTWQIWLCVVGATLLIQCGVTRRADTAAT